MLTIKRSNTILYCEKWAEVVMFYENTLACPISAESDWFVEFHLHGDSYLSIADVSRATINTAGGDGITLTWQVENIEALREALVEKGVEVSNIKERWEAKVCYFFDPEGHRIELWEG